MIGTVKLARCRCEPSHLDIGECPQYGGRPHTCEMRFGDYGLDKPPCIHCGQTLVRILHSPGHLIAGKVCQFPDPWRYCFIAEKVHVAAVADPLCIPEWRRA